MNIFWGGYYAAYNTSVTKPVITLDSWGPVLLQKCRICFSVIVSWGKGAGLFILHSPSVIDRGLPPGVLVPWHYPA